jgi:hypothetical protein
LLEVSFQIQQRQPNTNGLEEGRSLTTLHLLLASSNPSIALAALQGDPAFSHRRMSLEPGTK